MYSIIWSQGKYAHKDSLMFPLEERGLQFGDGVYEVIRVYRGKTYLLDEHIKRLFRSLEAIHIKINFSEHEIKSALTTMLERNHIDEDAFIYLQVTRGTAERDHLFPQGVEPNIYAYAKKRERPLEIIKHGVKAITLDDERWDNCYIKSLNLLPNVLAKQKAADEGAYEAILHRGEIVTEGSSSNIFLVKNETIYTHPESKYILSGCVRNAILRFSKELNFSLTEKAFEVSAIEDADELFLSSSTAEIVPIIQVNDKLIADGKPGTVTKKLQEAYEKDAQIIQTKIIN